MKGERSFAPLRDKGHCSQPPATSNQISVGKGPVERKFLWYCGQYCTLIKNFLLPFYNLFNCLSFLFFLPLYLLPLLSTIFSFVLPGILYVWWFIYYKKFNSVGKERVRFESRGILYSIYIKIPFQPESVTTCWSPSTMAWVSVPGNSKRSFRFYPEWVTGNSQPPLCLTL